MSETTEKPTRLLPESGSLDAEPSTKSTKSELGRESDKVRPGRTLELEFCHTVVFFAIAWERKERSRAKGITTLYSDSDSACPEDV